MRYLVPEWYLQDAVMLTWPHQFSDWADNLLAVETEMLAFAKAIVQHERLLLVCFDEAQRQHLQKAFVEHGIDLEKVNFAIASSYSHSDCYYQLSLHLC